MDKKKLKALLEGKFELAFPVCELRQRGTDTPEVIQGGGFLSQDAHGGLVVRMVCASSREWIEALRLDWGRPWSAGKLIPETEYYDLRCETVDGNEWRAQRVSPRLNYGPNGTSAQVRVWRIEHQSELPKKVETGVVSTFIPGDVEFPWHIWTSTGELSGAMDQFKHDAGRFAWGAKREEGGVRLEFNARGAPLEAAFTHFWRALCIALGRPIEAPVFTLYEGTTQTQRLATRHTALASLRLLAPFGGIAPDAATVHAFIAAYLERAMASAGESVDAYGETFSSRVHRSWHRIVRAREEDIENYSLVLSVMIEGVLSKHFATEHDVDPEFLKQVSQAQELLKGLALGERARKCIEGRLASASQSRAVDALRRLVEQGFLKPAHVSAWTKLRNTAAHGGKDLEQDERKLQALVDQVHICLDLFYRLVFVLIGYRGNHRDYSVSCEAGQPSWPDAPFPNPKDMEQADPATPAAASA